MEMLTLISFIPIERLLIVTLKISLKEVSATERVIIDFNTTNYIKPSSLFSFLSAKLNQRLAMIPSKIKTCISVYFASVWVPRILLALFAKYVYLYLPYSFLRARIKVGAP
jgi:hypothetical protein